MTFNIEGATDHSISVEQNEKYLHRTTVTFLISDIFLRWVSRIYPTVHFDYSYAHIYQLTVEDFVVESHHGRFHHVIAP